eukprot:1092771-Prorocentrum_lima.AAC.1
MPSGADPGEASVHSSPAETGPQGSSLSPQVGEPLVRPGAAGPPDFAEDDTLSVYSGGLNTDAVEALQLDEAQPGEMWQK